MNSREMLSKISVTEKKYSSALNIVLLFVLAGGLFGFMLGNRPLSVPDEGRYVEISREMIVAGDWMTPRLNGVKYFEKPPLFYWFEAALIALFGLKEWAVRLGPALFAFFGCVVVHHAGSRLHSPRSGILSAMVLATSMLYYAMSRTVILDMPLTVFLSAALLSFLLGIREAPGRKRKLYLYGFYACAALATLTKGLIGILVPFLVIGAWVLILKEWRLLRSVHPGAGSLIFLAIAAPWHLFVQKANPEFFNFYFIHEHVLRYVTTIHAHYRPFWYFIPVLVLGLFPWSAFGIGAVRQSLSGSSSGRDEKRTAVFLLLWVGLVFLFFSSSGSKLAPYILPVFPAASLLIGRYFSAAWESPDFPGIRAGFNLLAAASVLLAGVLLVLPHFPAGKALVAVGPYRYTLAATLVFGSLASWAFARYHGFRKACIAVGATAALFLVQANAAAPPLDRKSVKKTAIALRERLKPEDEVASYRTYYQDLPVYLERRITVVDWKGELAFGAGVEDASEWMIDHATLLLRWQGPSTLYLITSIEKYDLLRKYSRLTMFPVMRDPGNIVVTNKKTESPGP